MSLNGYHEHIDWEKSVHCAHPKCRQLHHCPDMDEPPTRFTCDACGSINRWSRLNEAYVAMPKNPRKPIWGEGNPAIMRMRGLRIEEEKYKKEILGG